MFKQLTGRISNYATRDPQEQEAQKQGILNRLRGKLPTAGIGGVPAMGAAMSGMFGGGIKRPFKGMAAGSPVDGMAVGAPVDGGTAPVGPIDDGMTSKMGWMKGNMAAGAPIDGGMATGDASSGGALDGGISKIAGQISPDQWAALLQAINAKRLIMNGGAAAPAEGVLYGGGQM